VGDVISFCRLCGASCGVTVSVEDGVVTKVAGDPDHPLSRGYVCPKGRKMGALVDDHARLDRPLMRNAKGELVAVDWDTALGDLAERLTKVREEHDGYAIGAYTGTVGDGAGRSSLEKLLRAVDSPSKYGSLTIDSVAKVLVPKLMAGREGLVTAVDFEHTTLLLVIGENLVVSHGGYSYFPDPVRYVRDVERRGEVWVLDPRRTETARLASRHLTPRGGTDFAVLAHLVREVLLEGADAAYLDEHASNLDELRGAVERFDVTTTAVITGLAADDLTALVAAVRRHRRLAIITGTGVTMAATGNVTEWMAFALQIVTGSFERPGGRWFNHGPSALPSQSVALPDTGGFGPGPRTRPDIGRLQNQYPCAVMPAEIEQGHLRALLVVGGNPLAAFPQPDRLRKAFDQLDALAVWDIVLSATAKRATHVFPSTSPLERADVSMGVHVSAVFAQYTPALVTLTGERRPVWWSMAKLARRMGIELLPDGADPDSYTDEDVLGSMLAAGAVDWDELLTNGNRPVQYPYEEGWVARSGLRGGRWDLAPDQLVDRLEHAVSRPIHPLVLGNRREVHHTNSVFTWEQEGGQTPRPFVYLSPHDAADAGAVNGAIVEVASPFGSLTGEARVDESMARGTLVVPHGFTDPSVGHLSATDVDLDPLTGMPTLVGIPVSVRVVVGTPA
jgi:anaerobic selenocysteine-containing dehydrogenase